MYIAPGKFKISSNLTAINTEATKEYISKTKHCPNIADQEKTASFCMNSNLVLKLIRRERK